MLTIKQNLVGFGLMACLAACATAQENPNYKYSSKFEGQEDVRMVANSEANAVHNASYYNPNAVVNAQGQAANVEGQYDIQRDFTNSSTGAPVVTPQAVYSSQSTPASASAAAGYPTTQGYGVPASSHLASAETASTDYYSTTVQQDSTSAAPTDTAYAGQKVDGTPGYGVYIPETTPQENIPHVTAPQSVVSANTNMAPTNEYHEVGRAHSLQTQLPAFTPAPTMVMTSSTNGAYVVKQGDTVYSLSRQLCVGVEAFQTANGIGSNFGIQIGQTLLLPQSEC